MAQPKASKITISLPSALVDFADRLARERSTTRSGVIAGLLKKEEEAIVLEHMEEGYHEMAEENLLLAEEAFPYTSQMIQQNTVWEEKVDG